MDTVLIDIGNSRTKWRAVDVRNGFTSDDPQGAVSHGDTAELSQAWRALPIKTVWIANVAHAHALASVRDALEEGQRGVEIAVLVARTEQAGVTNCYSEPERLGADRWAALIGAHALYPEQNVVIASLGTATTIDVLCADGRFTGGVILPGIRLMRNALARNTAGLPLARGHYAPLARNTDDAIASGIVHAQAGAIERVFLQAGLRARDPQVTPPSATRAICLLTGGDAPAIQPHLPFFALLADNLVLRGLLEVAREGSPAKVQP